MAKKPARYQIQKDEVTPGTTRLLAAFDAIALGAPHPQVDAWRRQVFGRYSAFLRRRYSIFSRGGGGWAALSPRTVARKRAKNRRNKNPLILRDTNTLYNSLNPGMPGNQSDVVPGGVAFGYRNFPHPGGPNVAELAEWHQFGGGRLPARPILVDPDDKTRKQIQLDFDRMLQRVERSGA